MYNLISSIFSKFLYFCLIVFLLFFHQLTFSNPTASNSVNILHQALLKIHKNKITNSEFLKIVESSYNVEKMISAIIGGRWKNISDQNKDRLQKSFRKYIAKNYISQFRKIKNPEFRNIEEKKIGEKYWLINSKLILTNEEIKIDYLLTFENDQWKIFDILLAGSISEIATKKSEFQKHLADGNYEVLIKKLENTKNEITFN
jgi:phospholipid transport system substrate-binding protein